MFSYSSGIFVRCRKFPVGYSGFSVIKVKNCLAASKSRLLTACFTRLNISYPPLTVKSLTACDTAYSQPQRRVRLWRVWVGFSLLCLCWCCALLLAPCKWQRITACSQWHEVGHMIEAGDKEARGRLGCMKQGTEPHWQKLNSSGGTAATASSGVCTHHAVTRVGMEEDTSLNSLVGFWW